MPLKEFTCVSMPYPYCRTPSLLLRCSRGLLHDAPLNEDIDRGHSGTQPVRYTDVVMLIDSDDGAIPTEAHLYAVDVHWLTGEIYSYNDDDDAVNHIIACETSFKIPCDGLASEDYAMEITSFLHRGHSITEPKCTCMHQLTTARALQLGVTTCRAGQCPCVRVPADTESIAREIAVDDFINYVDTSGVHLRSMLTNCSAIVPNQGIRCPADLLLKLRALAPFPMQMPSPVDSYAGIQRDSERLQMSGQIAMLPSAHAGMWSLFYIDDMGIRVDPDVKRLWCN